MKKTAETVALIIVVAVIAISVYSLLHPGSKDLQEKYDRQDLQYAGMRETISSCEEDLLVLYSYFEETGVDQETARRSFSRVMEKYHDLTND